MTYKFQINLRGIIDLLSQHLYSGPQVFLRELLQNGTDAIQARAYLEPKHRGEITLEVITPRPPAPPTLVFSDNGAGLTEDEIHRFLATIGESSKRPGHWDRPTDFLGQFGIGLLSCFVVADEIVVITRSARGDGQRAMEWRGRQDGTYTVRALDRDVEPGTQVYLTARKGCEEFFEPERVAALAEHFGALLPFPVRFVSGEVTRTINAERPPWRREFTSALARRDALLDFGKRTFGLDFFDAIPLRAAAGELDGVAFVLPFSPSLATRRTHRVYLKNMLLSECAENLLPEWAFFVKCVVNANALRPTASRESFYEDDALDTTRLQLGECLREYLVNLARRDPDRLQRLIALHYLSIKALAVQDDEFYRLFIDWLPFETSLGEMTFGEYRKQHPVVRYVRSLDQFRQIARVAAAQGLCVLNGAYTYNAELLDKFADLFPESRAEVIDPSSLAQSFDDLTLEEQEGVFTLVRAADQALQPFKCAADVKKFLPNELPALYCAGPNANFLRSVDQSREVADPLWSGVLDSLARRAPGDSYARLVLNHNNPLVRRLARLQGKALLQRSVQMLYVQALLLGHHPLSAREMAVLNEGLIGLIESGVEAQERGGE